MRRVVLAGTSVLAIVWAAPAAASAAEAAAPEVDQIVVTGTRAARTASQSATPIDVLSARALEQTAAEDIGPALEKLAPSFNLPRATVGTGSYVRAATLRGLAPDQTLVLVNGRRRHSSAVVSTNNSVGRGSAATDLATIPLAAIDRIEVLRDNASAQYGSDAIAGVINIVLRDRSDGGEGSLFLRKTEIADGGAARLSGWAGFALPRGGSLTLSAETARSQRTNNALPNTNGTPATNPDFGKTTSWYGDPEVTSSSLTANWKMPLSDSVEQYGFATYNRRKTTSPGLPRDPNGPFKPVDNKLFYPNGYLVELDAHQDDYDIEAGLRGKAGGWNWDAFAGYGLNTIDLDLRNSVNASLGKASPTAFYVGGFDYAQFIAGLEAVRRFDVLNGLNLAGGVGYRRETFEIARGDTASRFELGSDVFRGIEPFSAVDESRHSQYGFVDAELGLTETLRLTGAARYEHYSDFGGSLTGKIGGRWDMSPMLALRGSVSTGFRAPALQQAYYTSVTVRTDPTSPTGTATVGTFPADSAPAAAVGARPLEPETSRQVSVGLVVTPAPALTVTADFFRTRVDDRIVLSEQLSGAAVNAALKGSNVPGVTAISFFTNAVDTTTQGIELVGTYRGEAFGGRWSLVGAYSHYRTKIDRLKVNTKVPALPLLAVRSITLLVDSQPETNATVSLDFERGPWTLAASVRHYGAYVVSFGDLMHMASKNVTDVSAGWRLSDAVRIQASIDNLFDEHPDTFQQRATTQAARLTALGLHYPEESPFTANGRAAALRLTVSF